MADSKPTQIGRDALAHRFMDFLETNCSGGNFQTEPTALYHGRPARLRYIPQKYMDQPGLLQVHLGAQPSEGTASRCSVTHLTSSST